MHNLRREDYEQAADAAHAAQSATAARLVLDHLWLRHAREVRDASPPRGAVSADPAEVERDEPRRRFWASTDPPPERLILWRGNAGVGWEVEYVRASPSPPACRSPNA